MGSVGAESTIFRALQAICDIMSLKRRNGDYALNVTFLHGFSVKVVEILFEKVAFSRW